MIFSMDFNLIFAFVLMVGQINIVKTIVYEI